MFTNSASTIPKHQRRLFMQMQYHCLKHQWKTLCVVSLFLNCLLLFSSKTSDAAIINNTHNNLQFDLIRRQSLFHLILQSEKDKLSDRDIVNLVNDIYTLHNKTVTFIQVGAANGDYQSTNDPMQRNAFLSSNWKGIMMEPVPWLFDGLKKNINNDNSQRLTLLNAALVANDDKDKHKIFYRVDLELLKEKIRATGGMWDVRLAEQAHFIGSFYKNHIVKHLVQHLKMSQVEANFYVKEISVETMTARNVFEDLNVSKKNIDLFVVDTEGYDFIVLKQFLLQFTEFRPWIVIYEDYHLNNNDKQSAKQMLHNMGYYTLQSGLNVLCIKM